MKKRLFALLLAMLMVCALLPVTAMAEAEEPAAETVEETVEEVAEPKGETVEPEGEIAVEPEEESVDEVEKSVDETEEAVDETEKSVDEAEKSVDEAEKPVDGEAEETDELVLNGADDKVIYNEISSLGSTVYIAVVSISNSKAITIDKGGDGSVVVAGTAPNRTIELSKGTHIKIEAGAGGYALSLEDPPKSWNYVYVEGGAMKLAKAADGYANWNMDAYGLYYNAGGTKYYFTTVNKDNSTLSTTPNADIVIFGGDQPAPGGGPGPEEKETDEQAPVFTKQPEGKEFVTAGGEATFEVDAERTKQSDKSITTEGIAFQWYLDGEKIDGKTGKTLVYNFADMAAGVYTLTCKATYVDSKKEEHTTESTPAAYIIAADVSNDYLLFSDIHQEPDNIADVLKTYMSLNDYYLPTLVFASGDYCNDGGTAEDTALREQLDAIDAMLGGLHTIYLAGNHEKSTLIGLLNEKNFKIAKTGCIMNEGAYVYTINYDEIEGKSYSNIIGQVEAFLKTATKDQPIIFVAHAGIHMVEEWGGGDDYNIDLSDQMVDLLNKYGKDKKIFFFFGHDHSRGEAEFYMTAGKPITSTYSYSDSLNRTQTLNFTYGHMGYLNTKIGAGAGRATVLSFGDSGISMYMIDKSGKVVGMEKTIEAAGGADVPVVSALAKTATIGDTLKAEVAGNNPPPPPPKLSLDGEREPKPESKFEYQWYTNTDSDTASVSDGATRIEGAIKDSYTVKEGDLGKYIFCKVTVKDSDVFATTTAAKITDGKDEPVPEFKAGNYVIVLDDGSKTYAAVCGADGTVTAKEVKVKDGKVIGPVGDEYLWIVKSKDGETIQNVGTDLFLNRTSAKDGGTAKINAIADGTAKWTYDDANTLLYNKSGDGKNFFYPSLNMGAFAMGQMSALGKGEVSIYLMQVGTDTPPAQPNTNANKAPATGDSGHAALWALLVLGMGAGAVLVSKKKFN